MRETRKYEIYRIEELITLTIVPSFFALLFASR